MINRKYYLFGRIRLSVLRILVVSLMVASIILGYGGFCAEPAKDVLIGTSITPQPASGLVATAAAPTRIELAWQDNSNNETGFRVERSADAAGNYELRANANQNATTWADTTVAEATAYYYRIVAYNTYGNSEPSNIAGVTTPWTITTLDSQGNVGGYTALALDVDNKVHISYYDYVNTDLKYAKSADGVPPNGGITWTISTVDSAGDVGEFSSIAIDHNNKVHISYYDRVNTNLKYATNAGGTGWVTAIVDANGDIGFYSSIGIDANNKAHISYYDNTTSDLKYATNAGGSWQVGAIDTTGRVGLFAALVVDPVNKIHISYYDQTNGDLKYATNQSGSWVASTIDSTGDVGFYTDIATDSNNKIHISYSDWTNRDLKYATNASDAWVASVVDSGGEPPLTGTGEVGDFTSIAVDSANIPHISYHDTTNRSLKYARLRQGSGGQATDWEITTVDRLPLEVSEAESQRSPEQSIGVGQYSAIALGARQVHISYLDMKDWDLKYASNSKGAWVIPAPANLIAAAVSSYRINLTWVDNAPNEEGFKVERKSELDDTYHEIATLAPNTISYADTNLSVFTVYFYRVRAFSTTRNSLFSNEASARTLYIPPAVPVLLLPANNAVNMTTLPTLTWAVAMDAITYQLQVSTGADFPAGAGRIADLAGITTTSYSSSSLANLTAYWWRVRAQNRGGTGDWSTPYGFTTITAPPSQPTLASPANGAVDIPTADTTLPSYEGAHLQWNSTNLAAYYRIQIATDTAFSNIVIDQTNIVSTTFSTATLSQYSTVHYWRVKALNVGGESAWSVGWSFTTVIAPPDAAPVLAIPDNNATWLSLSPVFIWESVTTAASYQIQAATSSSFATPVIDQPNIAVTSYQGAGLSNDISYYWRVRGMNLGGPGPWSGAWRFTTIIANPAQATLSSPANTAGNVPITPVLAWNITNGAASYRVQVSSNSDFTDLAAGDISGITATSHLLSILSYLSTYYWRVQAVNAAGTGPWSEAWAFTTIIAPPAVPVLFTPANGAVGQALNLALEWGAAQRATAYRIQVTTDINFTNITIDQPGLTVTSYQPAGLANNTVYYWRVQASNIGGDGNWSGANNFKTIIGAPATVAYPAHNATLIAIAGTTLQWNSIATATAYDIQVATSADFPAGAGRIVDLEVTSTSYALSSLLNDTTYYWRIRSKNAEGTSVWSQAFIFTTIMLPPVQPVLSSPAAGATGVVTSPSLQWSAAARAASYRIQIATVSDFSSTIRDQSGISGISYQISNLSATTVYYWRIKSVNPAGESAWSSVFSFTTTIAPPPLASPANNSYGVVLNPTLAWSYSMPGTTYQLQVSTSSNFQTMLVDQSNINATSFPIAGLTNNTIYYWRVKAANTFGISDWSGVWQFTAALGQVVLSTPANSSGAVAVRPPFTWTLPGGATSYRLQIATDSGFVGIVLDQPGITATSFTPASSLNYYTPYYWHVQPSNAGGTGSWSGTFGFTTLVDPPALVSPGNAIQSVPTNPTFYWNAVVGATYYRFQISTNATFGTTLLDRNNIAGTSTAVSGLGDNTAYYWRVKGANTAGEGDYSASWSFRTVIPATTLTSPVTGTVLAPLNPTLQWNSSAYATSYRVEVATDANFTLNYQQRTTTATSYQFIGLGYATVYYWRVQVVGTLGQSNWTGAWTFTTLPPAPAQPQLDSPANGITRTSTALALKWNAADYATSYRVQVSASSGFSSLINDVQISATSHIVSDGLSSGVTYYWRVNAINGTGTSAWSPASGGWSFSTVPVVPDQPMLLSPAGGITGLPLPFTLAWYPTTNATHYRVRISTDDFFNNIIQDQGNITMTSFTPSALQYGAAYYWQVQAINVTEISDWSVARSFRVIGIPTLSLPSNSTLISADNCLLAWNTSNDNSSYRVQVSKDPNFITAFVADQSGITETSYTITGLNTWTMYFWRVQGISGEGVSAWTGNRSFYRTLSNPSGGNWTYSRPLTITNSGSTLSDYQIELNLFTDSAFINNTGLVGSWHFSESSGTVAADMSGLANYGNLTAGGVVVDNCDANTGWVKGGAGGSISANSYRYKEGAASLNLIKSAGSADSYFYKIIPTKNMQNKWLNVWLYIANQAAFNKIDKVEIFAMKSDDSWYAYKSPILPDSLTTGWNLLSFNTSAPSGTFGIPNMADITKIRIDVDTQLTTDAFSAEEILMDYWFLSDAQPVLPVWSDGKSGKALTFDGGSSYVRVGNSTSLENITEGSFTFESWVKPADVPLGIYPPGPYSIIAKPGYHTGLRYESNKKFTLAMYNTANTSFNATTTATYEPGNWHYVVGTFDMDTNTMRIYVNGQLQGTTTFSGTPRDFGTSSLYIGCADPANTLYPYWFKGIIDEVRAYNRALSAGEITLRYNPASGGTPKLRGDYADLRFTNPDGTQEYSYWQENDNKIWLKLPTITGGGASIAIRMFYGNISATSSTSMANTFIFGDDFPGSSLDAGWSQAVSWPATITVNSGIVLLDNNAATGNVSISRTGIITPCRVETMAKLEYPYGNPRHRFNTPSAPYDIGVRDSNQVYWNALISGVYAPNNSYVRLKQLYQDSQVDWQIYRVDGSYIYSNSYTPSGSPSVISYSPCDNGSNGARMTLDWVFVRKYAATEPILAVTGAELPMNTPSDVAATVISASRVDLAWKDNSPVEDGFKIERSANGGVDWAQIGAIAANGVTFTDTTVIFGNTYFYRVRSYNISSDDAYSSPVNTRVYQPDSPTGLTAGAVTLSSVLMQWTDKSNNETNFRVERSTDGGWNYTLAALLPANTTTWTDTGLSRLTTYYYKVTAVNAIGDSPTFIIMTITTKFLPNDGGGNWTYFRSITITNAGAPITDYQMAITPFTDASFINNTGLVGSWHLSEGAGTTALDTSGNANHGTLTNNPVWANGKFGKAISFDGIDDYITVADSAAFDWTSAGITIEAWINGAIPSVAKGIVSKSAGGGTPYEFNFSVETDGRIRFWVSADGTTTGSLAYSGSAITANNWNHIVATYNGANLIVYRNAVAGTAVARTGTLFNGTGNLDIGRWPTSGWNWPGLIDEVKVYSRALLLPEIQARYNAGTNSGSNKVAGDYGDIRFTNADMTQELPFWQESDSRFWVKVPDVPAGNSSIRLFYGNISATSLSSNAATIFSGDVSYHPTPPWYRYTANPVMNLGVSSTWDDVHVQSPCVIKDGGVYKMWYMGYDSATWRIGYATSIDGINWTKYSGNPVINLGTGGSWDDTHAYEPFVMKDTDGTYKMWYGMHDGANVRLGYATSPDGVTWTKYASNPVLNLGTGWESVHVYKPWIIRDGATYKMWYGGYDGVASWRTGYATSPDGITWTKYSGNPVLNLGTGWDSLHTFNPCVIKEDGIYKMFYYGQSSTSNARIGYATSTDGVIWTKYANNPILNSGGGWESVHVYNPSVLKDDDGKYKMWYSGQDSTNARIGYAWTYGRKFASPEPTAAMTAENTVNTTTNLVATVMWYNQVDLVWQDNSVGETGFKIERSTDGANWTPISATTTANATTYSDITAGSDTTYYYRVRSYKDSADHPASGYVVTLTSPPNTPLNLVTTTVTASTIGLQWNDMSNNESGFRIETSGDGTSGWTHLITVTANTTTYTDTGLATNATYWYRVLASNGIGNSGYTTPISATAATSGVVATGGAITESGNYKIHTFTLTGTFAFTVTAGSGNVAVLVVAGGGGGGRRLVNNGGAGGGGAGGFRTATGYAVVPQAYTVTIGAGGAGATTDNTSGSNGQNSVFDTIIATGGGGGGGNYGSGQGGSGGSGGSAGQASGSTYRGLGTAGQGYDGGYSTANHNSAAAGGGAGGVGGNTSQDVGGVGGAGLASSISGVSTYYAGGGGGGNWSSSAGRTGGVGGGGTGSYNGVAGTAGSPNTGGGGGGGALGNGYAGGSGIVIVRYSAPSPDTINIPTNITAAVVSDIRIDLAWQDNSTAESGFKIERSPNGSTGWTQIVTTTANATTFVNDSGISAGPDYYYRIRSYDARVNHPYSTVISATTTAPADPSNLITTTATSGLNIGLQWTDNSFGEQGFQLEQSVDGTNWTVTYTPLANTNVYINTGLAFSTIYWYRVRAYNGLGTSGYSTPISATTPAPVNVAFYPTGTGQTGSIQTWTVPYTGVYRIEASGSQGGTQPTSYTGNNGGRGARMRGDFTLTAGTQLKILVGQQGTAYAYDAGGGGGTFVVTGTSNAVIIAGGGGGASGNNNAYDAVTTNNGTNGNAGGTAGGTGGGGGATVNSGAGGGLTGNGADGSGSLQGGRSFTNGGTGGNTGSSNCYGGFGGGGGSHGWGWGGGGGGGYSGGGGSNWANGGGGGGSYNSGANQSNSAGVHYGPGLVIIQTVPTVNQTFYPTSSGRNGSIQTWVVPTTGLYQIEVWGSHGGTNPTGYLSNPSGKGARMRGDFTLTAGTTLYILVGQQGTAFSNDGGGGGGTFVVTGTSNAVIIAGGGGGASGNNNAYDAVTTNNGTNGNAGGTAGGTGGGGGATVNSGAGGGLTGNGADGSGSLQGGRSFTNGGTGGNTGSSNCYGGFGGGGGSHGGGWGGGGGGGYSGGGGSNWANGGGGGGSYNSGANQSNSAGVTRGQGLVTIQSLF